MNVQAATVTWTGAGGDSFWHNSTNWSGGILPGAADDVTISLAGASVVFSQGTNTVRSVTCSRPLTISGGALTVTNGFNLNNIVFTFTGGTLNVTNLATVTGGTTALKDGQIVGQLKLVNGTLTFSNNAAATGTVVFNGSNNRLNSDVPPGMLLWVQGGGSSTGELDITNNVVNRGTILLQTTVSTFASGLDVSGGAVLINETNGVIQVSPGTGGTRPLDGWLENRGTVLVESNTTLTVQGATPRWTQKSGLVQALGEFRLSGGRVDFEGGRLEGVVRALNSFINVSNSVTEASTLRVIGNTGVLGGNHSPLVTLWVEGGGSSTGELNITNTAVNRGTILLETSTSTFASALDVDVGAVLVNGTNAVIQANAGTGGPRNISGYLENHGILRGNTELSFQNATFDFKYGRIEGLVRFTSSYLKVANSVTEVSTVRAIGSTCVLGGNESPAVTIWVEGGPASTGELDVTNNVVNRGTILLETSSSTYESRLGINSGARLTNDVGGLVRASVGTGGTRSVTGTLENFGTVRANSNVTFTVQSLVQRAGVVLGEGECRLTGLFDFRGGQLIGTVRANSGYIAVADTVTQVSTLSVVGGSGILASNASPSVTLWVEGHPSFGSAGNLTVTNNTINRGTLLLDVTTAGGYSSALTVNSGAVLTNLTNGLIRANLGPGGARTFSGDLENWGTVVAGTNLTFTIPGRLRQMNGVLRGDGTLVKQGGVFEFNGGRIEGTVRLNGSFICVADTVTEASTVSVVGGAGVLASNASPAVTLWIEGHPSFAPAGFLTVTNNTVNRGTILLDVTTAGGYSSELTINPGAVLTNATNGLIQASVGPGGARTLNGELENRGTVRATSNTTFTVNGRLRQAGGVLRGDGTLLKQGGNFEFSGGRLEGQVRAHSAFIAVAPAVSESSTLLATGSGGVLASNASPAVTVWVDAGPAYGNPGLLNVTNTAVNRGTIRLEVTTPGGYSSEMAVGTGGVLVNATNGVIEANVGPGGSRTLSGSVTNQGLVSIAGATLNLTTGPFVNDVPGLITGTGTISFSGNIFTNHGIVSPGASPGILSFSGNYAQSSAGRLNVEINGDTAGTNYDRLAVTGTATLDGALNVTVAENYFPAISNTFRVLTFTSRNGDFASYNGLNFYTNLALVANYTGTALDLVTVSATNQTFTSPTIVGQPASKSVLSGQNVTFNVTAAGTRPFSYQWRFNGTNLAGATSSILALSNVQTNQAGDYRAVVTNVAGAVTSSVAVLTVQPISDLVVTDLVTPTNVFSGQPVALNWRSLNQGSQTAPAPWTESVGISTNAAGVPEIGLASFTFTNSLGAGQSLVRTQTVNVPGGLDGDFYWIFHTDIYNQVAEQANETNNTIISASSTRLRSPDLQPTGVTPASSSATLGQPLAVSWVSTNAGSAPVSAPWGDRVYLGTLSNSLSGALPLAISTVSNVPVAAFGLATNSANVTLPLSESWPPGNYYLLVSVDYANAVAEFAETNNLCSAPLTLTLPPLPDLAAVNVLAPSNALPGQTISLAWSTTNRGSLAITGAWSETIYLATNSAGAGLLEIITFDFTNTLAPGGIVMRTQNVTVPIASPLGNSWFAMLADSRDDVFEGIETNNLGVAQSPTTIPAVLTLQLSATQISEAAAQPILATITRNGSRASPLLVTITNNEPTELIAQTNVIILAGQASVSFNVFAVTDGIVDGPQNVQISAAAAGFSNAVASVTVLDSDLPHLAVTVTNIAFEGASLTAKVARDAGTNTAVVVNVASSNPGRLMPLGPVVLSVGQFSTNVQLMAIEDLLVQVPVTNTITVSAANHVSGSTEVVVLDDDLPVVTLSLASTNVSENAGPQATIATLTRLPVTSTPIYIELASTNPGALLVPSLVTIPASEVSASVPVAAVNNDLLDGVKHAEVRFWVKTSAFGSRVAEGAPVLVTVTDDEGPALKLTLAQSLVPEGASPATVATVSRNTGTNSSLLVNLASSNTGEATVPASVTIAAGATSTNFNVTTPTDGVFDSNKVVTISASASGFAGASAPLTVSDVNQPDLVIQSVSAPANAETETFVSLGYTIRNQGLSAMASNTLVQRIYLSRDPVVGDDLLMGEYSFNGALPVGPPFGQTFSVRLPQEAGDYWVIAETDVQNAVAEILEDNNRRISAAPIHVTAAYDAVVSTTLQSASANTPVPLTGQAFKPGSIPAPFVLVNIHINVRGLHRVISALTDFAGNFSTTWQPLPGEAGFYEIGAAHPGYTNAPAQDSFALYGMNAVPASPTVTLMGQGVVTGAVDIVNSGDLALNSVSAQVLSPPGNLSFNVAMPTNFIPGLGSNPLTYTINSTDGLAAQGVVVVRLTSTEGATLDVPFSVTVKPLTPQLEVTPSQLVRGMKRGVQTMVSFVVTNVGGAASGPITVSLPSLDWLDVASANPLPSLAPGEGASVSLQLTPPTNMPLTAVTGNLLLGAGGNVTAVPFEFRALSESKGDLRVTASDEFTYYAVGAPKVTNAVAVLRDAVSGVVVTNGVTGTNGEWFTAQLPEGYYELEVTADKHTAYKGTHLLLVGVTNEIGAFMSRQTVRYTWTVVPTEIEDRYKIVVNTEFEANVPAPVVTIEPAVIDLADLEDEMQVDLKIENHGLIAAEDFELQFDEHESVVFEPLVSRLGTLPAKSTFTVPLKIRRVSAAILGGPRKNALNNVGACFATGRGIDHFQCGPFFNVQVTTISFPNAGSCISEVIRTIYDWLPGGGGVVLPPRQGECQNCYVDPVRRYYGYYSSSGGGSRLLDLLLAAIYQATPALAVPNLCDPDCLSSLIPALIGCFGPEDDGPDPCPENVGNCLPPLLLNPSEATVTDCMVQGVTCWFDYAKKNPAVECLFDLLSACAPQEEEAGPAKGKKVGKRSFSGPYAGLIGTLQTRVDRVVAVNDFYLKFLGDAVWRDTPDQNLVKSFFGQFNAAIAAGSDAGKTISAAELAGLLAEPLPTGATSVHVNHAAERWNRSVSYWAAGIFNLAQVPIGNSTDFLALDQLHTASVAATNAIHENQLEGFSSLAASLVAAKQDIADAISEGSGGTCAKVKLRLDQEAVMSRDAFKAKLEIDNREGRPLENLYVTLGVLDSEGNDASALFSIRAPELSGVSGTNGNGTLADDQIGQITWTLVPTVDAAPTNSTQYFVSGGLNYIVNSNAVSIPLSPATITVRPSPRLVVDYFHQRDVFSDDPFTDEIEPSIPFSLGVMVQNRGQGTAKNFRITSAQPKIVENEKGLLIDFKIIATEVAGQNLQPTLTADLGDIGPGTNAIARWLMTSTLQGLFIDYSATFEHVDGLGNAKLSLIDEVNIHEMIRVVQAGGGFADGRPDFLVNDVPDIHDFPDTIYLSGGATNHVEAVTNGVIIGTLSPGNLQVQLDAPLPGGWSYLRVPDPADGDYRLVGVMRSDGAVIGVETNAWITDRTFRGLGKKPVRENILHIVDFNSTGTYTLTYALLPQPDTTLPTSAVLALPAESSSVIPLVWSGADNVGVAGYDIYVSENGGAFTRWLERTINTSAIYQGLLSNSYAFYSVAMDQAGNREAAPTTPDAATTVTRTNHAPVLTTITNRTIVEGATLSVSLDVSDADGDAVTLTLAPGAPSGVSINSQSRTLTWVTGEAHGPSTNNLTVIARDNGLPQLSVSQSFTVIVLESNLPPSLAPISGTSVAEGQLLSFTAVASDLDLPPQPLAFSLAGAPLGATIDSGSGLFTWTPGDTQGGVTNLIKVIVTDNPGGGPGLSVTQAFNVVVLDTQPDFRVNIGTTQLLVGASANVPFMLQSGLDLTNVQWVLAINNSRLQNLTLQDITSVVGSADFQPFGSNRYSVRFSSHAGSFLQGNLLLARLAFDTGTNEHSAVAKLAVESLAGSRASAVGSINSAGVPGRVFIVGIEPLLDAYLAGGQFKIALYGKPGASFQLSYVTNLADTNWVVALQTPQTNLVQEIELPPTLPWAFYRAEDISPDPPLLMMQGLTESSMPLLLYGRRGSNYILEATDDLSGAGGWFAVSNVTSTNAFNYFTPARGTNNMMLFRVRRP